MAKKQKDQVSKCISKKVSKGHPQKQSVAICLSEAGQSKKKPKKKK